MLGAGVALLWESGTVDPIIESADRDVVRRIVVAMMRLKESPP
jgi:hypothetical protein